MAEQYDPQYWIERAQLVMEQNVVEDAKTAAEINRIITLMYAEIAKEIFAFYAKFATSEGLSVAEAKKVVDAFDVVAFKSKAKEYVKNKDFSEKANKELKKYNVKMKISREKLLKENLDLIVKSSTAEVEKAIESGLVDSINREVKEQAGILGVDLRITEEKAESIANSKFHKVTWSERLWDDMDLVREEVERITTNVVVRGRHPNEYVAEFKKKTGQTTYNAKRLLTTESARAQSEA
ncbi:phage head morphogenesis protein, partial [Staphylococcus hominis]